MEMHTISELYLGRKPRVRGEKYGVELENESSRLIEDFDMASFLHQGWSFHNEGSLRGNGYEFVSLPSGYEKLKESLLNLTNVLGKYEWSDSPRTSTHIHINVQDLTEEQLLVLCCCYWIFEPLYLKFAGPDREKNTFCISSTPDKFRILQNAKRNLGKYVLEGFNEDNFKYSSLNLCPVNRFGTIETRIMRGMSSPRNIIQWLGFVHKLNQGSRKIKTLEQLKKLFLDLEIDEFVSYFYSKKEFDFLKKDFNYKSLLREGFKSILPLFTIHNLFEAYKNKPENKTVYATDSIPDILQEVLNNIEEEERGE